MIAGVANAAPPVTTPASPARNQKGCLARRAKPRNAPTNAAASAPMAQPASATTGKSNTECMARSPTSKLATWPNVQCPTAFAVTAATSTGTNVATAYSMSTTSSANTTPAMGAFKEHESAAATPQARRTRALFCGIRNARAKVLAPAAPRCTAGPSAPPERPAPSAALPAKYWTPALASGSRACPCTRCSSTWDTPQRRRRAATGASSKPIRRAPPSGNAARVAGGSSAKPPPASCAASWPANSMVAKKAPTTKLVKAPAATANANSCGCAPPPAKRSRNASSAGARRVPGRLRTVIKGVLGGGLP